MFASFRFSVRGPCYASIVALCLLLTAACADRQTPASRPPGEAAAADSAVALLARTDDTAFRKAFEEVAELSHVHYVRIEQYDHDGRRLAYDERIVRRGGPNVRHVLSRHASGSFDFGYATRFVSTEPEPSDPSYLPAYVVPDDPPYASQRTMESYRYDVVADTLHGRAVRLVRISALPDVGDGQAIRRVRIYLEKESDRMMGIYIERLESALWFREESALFASVERLDSGGWVPKQTRFETWVRLPFRPPQRFRTVTSYYAFGDLEGR